ncbi:cytochrome P450 [Boletus reticuloceps]|uniref:Cytochrome P450 n=1 Tax=Boletus reticuloceps TaxID=495285 RepID=A0A8I3ACP0_9AGAM|nr:cytochrome P450 [Boletus reticuloceps]
MLSWFAFVLPLVLLLALWASKPLFVRRTRTYKHAAQIRTLLNPPDLSLRSLLLARAQPNQRLVHAFGLTSTFVSADTKLHRAFTTRAKVLLAGAGEKNDRWWGVASSAEVAVHHFLPVQQTTDFSTFIQCVTFSVVLSTLFDTDLDTLHYDDLVYVTNVINQRWKDSKIKDAAAMRQDDSLRKMMAYIDEWIVDRHQHPNPLNFILPAYETMWRVVAVTVAYIYRCCDNTLQDVAITFGRNPTEAQFQAFDFGHNGLQPSMQAIVLEVLRLHPPTRHIARAPVASGSSWWHTLVAPAVERADIEAVHLSDVYGENPSAFEPMRFHPSRVPVGGRAELYAFGYGRLRCVAAAWAPMAAAVIAAKVVAQIKDAGCVVTVGDKIGGRSGWDGWAIEKGTE